MAPPIEKRLNQSVVTSIGILICTCATCVALNMKVDAENSGMAVVMVEDFGEIPVKDPVPGMYPVHPPSIL